MTAPAGQEGLSIDPAPAAWLQSLGQSQSRPLVIMTGHQAEFWHPGILAKYFAADAAARALNASGRPATVAWLVADQDSNTPWKVPLPARAPAGPIKTVWQIPFRNGATASADAFAPDTPAAAMPPLEPPADALGAINGLQPALPCVREGLARIVQSLQAHKNESNVAQQVTLALRDLLSPYTKPASIVFASQLYKSTEFSDLLERVRADPGACTKAYNAAAAKFPKARVRPLIQEGGRIELPLWRTPDGPGRPRRPIFAADLNGIAPSQLAPRALLMSALVRLSSCDLFIHGTGGGLYEHVTNAWFSTWLPDRVLAPTAVVTATRLLPFDIKPPSPEFITRTQWTAHHALHNPAVLGDELAGARKLQLLQDLRTARSRGESPAIAFKAIHELLDSSRSEHKDQVAALATEAAQALEKRALAKVVYDRTWPFPLYPDSTIQGLKSQIDRAFALMP